MGLYMPSAIADHSGFKSLRSANLYLASLT
jgi:hypothetical protein